MRLTNLAVLATLGVVALLNSASAQSLTQALAHAYHHNPDLNSQRANLRVTNESVPATMSGYRPSLSGSASVGGSESRGTTAAGADFVTRQIPRTAGLTLSQPIFDGYRTKYSVESAEKGVMVGRQDLINKEQTVLLAAATAYADVVRDQAILNFRLSNIKTLQTQLKAAKDRLRVGDATKTDVALAEAQTQEANFQASKARGDLARSKAVFLQHIGLEAKKVSYANVAEKFLPKTRETAVSIGRSSHPAVKAAQYGADAAAVQVHVAQSALMPQLALNGGYNHGWDNSSTLRYAQGASITAALTVPIFASGGKDHSTIRAAKETHGQRQIQIDVARASVTQGVTSSWASLDSTKAQITAARASIAAQETALKGMTEGYKVGQNLIIDVLNANKFLNDARIATASAERDRVVAAFSILSSMGKLTAQTLGLKVDRYSPEAHYDAVKDKWFGTTTPDGR